MFPLIHRCNIQKLGTAYRGKAPLPWTRHTAPASFSVCRSRIRRLLAISDVTVPYCQMRNSSAAHMVDGLRHSLVKVNVFARVTHVLPVACQQDLDLFHAPAQHAVQRSIGERLRALLELQLIPDSKFFLHRPNGQHVCLGSCGGTLYHTSFLSLGQGPAGTLTTCS